MSVLRFLNLIDSDGRLSLSQSLLWLCAGLAIYGVVRDLGPESLVPFAVALLNYAHKRQVTGRPLDFDPLAMSAAVEEARQAAVAATVQAARASEEATQARNAVGLKSLRGAM